MVPPWDFLRFAAFTSKWLSSCELSSHNHDPGRTSAWVFLQILHVLDLAEKDCGSFISVLMALYYIIERRSFDLVADSYSYVPVPCKIYWLAIRYLACLSVYYYRFIMNNDLITLQPATRCQFTIDKMRVMMWFAKDKMREISQINFTIRQWHCTHACDVVRKRQDREISPK